MDDYCTSHGFADGGSAGLSGDCFNGTDTMPVQMVVNEYSISPAEDYFNGFVLGVNKECYLHSIQLN